MECCIGIKKKEMSMIQNNSKKPLPKLFDPLYRLYQKLQKRFYAIRSRNKIKDIAEYYLLLIELDNFVSNELYKTEEELLKLGIDKTRHNCIYLNQFSTAIEYEDKTNIFHIRDMKTKDFKRWVRGEENV